MFRAFDPDRDRLVAVKLFRLDLSPDRMHQLVAALDGLAAADVWHEAFAAPIAAGTDGVVVYLAQEFVSAESLDVVIRDRGLSPADALRVAAQLAGALDFAAIVNVHHGALHPRDVLLTSDETRVTGLGITRALEQVGVTPPVRRPYTAPERIAGGEWDRRADIFSLAALVHEMLWGRRVAGLGEDAARSLTDLGGGNLSALRAAFARALAEEPADRFDTALDFVLSLEAAFPDVAIAPAPAAPAVDEILSARMPRASGKVEEPVTGEADIAAAEGQLPTDITLAGDRLKPPTETVLGDFELFLDEPDRAGTAGLETTLAGPETRSGPARVPPPTEAKDTSRARPSLPLFDAYQADGPPAESTRVWPVAAALIVGLVSGFGGGYLVGERQRPPAVATAPASGQRPATPPAPSPAASSEAVSASAAGTAAASARREKIDGAATPDRAGAVSSARLPPSPEVSAQGRGAAQASSAGRAGEGGRPAAAPSRQGREATGAVRGVERDTGRLLVRSTPADALVFVDGRERGRTPITVGELSPGAHRVRIVHDGFATEDRRVVITSARPAESLAVTLDRRAEPGTAVTQRPALRTPPADGTSTGAINVESRPAGANVFLDGSLVGTTPLAMSRVAAGEHAIRLERDGYRRWSSSILVVGGERNRVTASLER